MVVMEFGMGGTASGSHRQVTKMEIWRSSEEPAAAFAMSMSMGANQLIQPKDIDVSALFLLFNNNGFSLTKGTGRAV